MDTPRLIGGRISSATFSLRLLPLMGVDVDPSNPAASQSGYRYSTKVGVEVLAFRSGSVLFDCSGWLPGAAVAIPEVEAVGGKRLPKQYMEADEKAKEHVFNRVQMANCFLASLSHAISHVQGTGLGLGQEVDPTNYLPVILNDRDPLSLADWEAEKVLQILGKARPPGEPSITLRTETFSSACDLLDSILQSPEATQLVSLYYKGGYRYAQHDFGLAAIIAWAVCEKSLNSIWLRHLQGIRSSKLPIPRMSRDREKKLTGRDYTASIVSESLELLGLIDHDLYTDLNSARQVRNSWMHSLAGVTDKDATQALTTAHKMIKAAYGIEVQIGLSRGMSYCTYSRGSCLGDGRWQRLRGSVAADSKQA